MEGHAGDRQAMSVASAIRFVTAKMASWSRPWKQAAERIVQVIKDAKLREKLGASARESVRQRFLLTRLMEQWLDLIGAFEARFRLRTGAE